jgi:hypothetical protein
MRDDIPMTLEDVHDFERLGMIAKEDHVVLVRKAEVTVTAPSSSARIVVRKSPCQQGAVQT